MNAKKKAEALARTVKNKAVPEQATKRATSAAAAASKSKLSNSRVMASKSPAAKRFGRSSSSASLKPKQTAAAAAVADAKATGKQSAADDDVVLVSADDDVFNDFGEITPFGSEDDDDDDSAAAAAAAASPRPPPASPTPPASPAAHPPAAAKVMAEGKGKGNLRKGSVKFSGIVSISPPAVAKAKAIARKGSVNFAAAPFFPAPGAVVRAKPSPKNTPKAVELTSATFQNMIKKTEPVHQRFKLTALLPGTLQGNHLPLIAGWNAGGGEDIVLRKCKDPSAALPSGKEARPYTCLVDLFDLDNTETSRARNKNVAIHAADMLKRNPPLTFVVFHKSFPAVQLYIFPTGRTGPVTTSVLDYADAIGVDFTESGPICGILKWTVNSRKMPFTFSGSLTLQPSAPPPDPRLEKKRAGGRGESSAAAAAAGGRGGGVASYLEKEEEEDDSFQNNGVHLEAIEKNVFDEYPTSRGMLKRKKRGGDPQHRALTTLLHMPPATRKDAHLDFVRKLVEDESHAMRRQKPRLSRNGEFLTFEEAFKSIKAREQCILYAEGACEHSADACLFVHTGPGGGGGGGSGSGGGGGTGFVAAMSPPRGPPPSTAPPRGSPPSTAPPRGFVAAMSPPRGPPPSMAPPRGPPPSMSPPRGPPPSTAPPRGSPPSTAPPRSSLPSKLMQLRASRTKLREASQPDGARIRRSSNSPGTPSSSSDSPGTPKSSSASSSPKSPDSSPGDDAPPLPQAPAQQYGGGYYEGKGGGGGGGGSAGRRFQERGMF